jgi:REP element-mobilizing transposase RayT
MPCRVRMCIPSLPYHIVQRANNRKANHIHFLLTPGTEKSIFNTMKVVDSRYAQYINLKSKRTGTLWSPFSSTVGIVLGSGCCLICMCV